MEPDEKARSLFYLALEEQTRGRLAEAEELYLRALSLTPDRPSILTNLAAVLMQQEKYDAAAPYIDRALEGAAGFVLRPSRRFAHALPYLRECAVEHGFVESGITRIVLRKEHGQDIDGVTVVLRVRER